MPMDEETKHALDQLRSELTERVDDIRADVDEHDHALMNLLRGRPTWASHDGEPSVPVQLQLLDTAAEALDGLAPERLKIWERLTKLAPTSRALIADLLAMPSGDQRAALAFCLILDEEARNQLRTQIEVAEQDEIDEIISEAKA